MNVNDLFNTPTADRPAALKNYGVRIHRGQPVGWAMEGYRLEMRHQSGRTPTHRGEPRNA